MNIYLLLAASLSVVVGLVHSVFGEIKIFSGLRKSNSKEVSGRAWGILWASWHIVTVFGFAFAAILFRAAIHPNAGFSPLLLQNTIAFALLMSATLVFVGTKGKHLGWLGLLIVAVLIFLARL